MRQYIEKEKKDSRAKMAPGRILAPGRVDVLPLWVTPSVEEPEFEEGCVEMTASNNKEKQKLEAPERTTFAFTDGSCITNPGSCEAGAIISGPTSANTIGDQLQR